MAKNKKRKKFNTYLLGQKKQQQNRVKLFNNIYLIYMEKTYPVLYRFAKIVNSDNIKLKFIAKAALEMALQQKLKEAVEVAKENLKEKVESNE